MSNPVSSKTSANGKDPEYQQRELDNRPPEVDARAQQQQQNGTGDDDLPPQRHAGAVGLGPEYGAQQAVVSAKARYNNQSSAAEPNIDRR